METKRQLVESSKDPLSVVIVGIGESNFMGMEFLDSFDARNEVGRDITKFVRFNDHHDFNSLTEAVLDEIPNQVVEYFYDTKGLLPKRTSSFDEDTVEVMPADDDERTLTYFEI